MDFKASERFHVSLLSDDGYGTEKIVCQIGLEGLFILSPDGQRTLRKYPLNHISRWALRSTNLVLYTKTPVDVEERTVTLQGSEHTIRSVLDTLTCSCMQMVELLQGSEKTGENRQATNSLNALLSGGNKPKAAALPAADEVEYWVSPEKAGWLQSQGDHIKTWRRRWFVLKQGYLFRFANPDVNITSKPRGIVDLSKVSDVRHGTGKGNSLMLCTTAGSVSYMADSETELVEWVSALEGTVARIVKQAAGVEEEPEPAPPARQQSEWARQLEKSFNAASTAGGALRAERNPTVRIMGYEAAGGGSAPARSATTSRDADYGRLTYDSIAGIAGVAGEPSQRQSRHPVLQSSSSFSDSFVKVDYPSYPVLTPSAEAPAPAPQTSHYNQHSGAHGYGYPHHAPPMQQGSYQPHPNHMQHQPQIQPHAHTFQPPPQALSEPAWQVHYTGEGRAYYHNSMTGTTQWEPPANMA